MSQRDVFIQLAKELLFDEKNETDLSEISQKNLAKVIEKEFQKCLLRYFQKFCPPAKLRESNCEEIVDVIARTFPSSAFFRWGSILPKFHEVSKKAGFNCTLQSAFLHFALEEQKDRLGLKRIASLITREHQAVLVEDRDGTKMFYDPSDVSIREPLGKFHVQDSNIKLNLGVLFENLFYLVEDSKKRIGDFPKEVQRRVKEAKKICEHFPILKQIDFLILEKQYEYPYQSIDF